MGNDPTPPPPPPLKTLIKTEGREKGRGGASGQYPSVDAGCPNCEGFFCGKTRWGFCSLDTLQCILPCLFLGGSVQRKKEIKGKRKGGNMGKHAMLLWRKPRDSNKKESPPPLTSLLCLLVGEEALDKFDQGGRIKSVGNWLPSIHRLKEGMNSLPSLFF